jgi:isoleucyl-tRNA synthetase
VLGTHSFDLLSDELRAEIADELNVRTLDSFATTGELVEHSVKANFRELGKRFAKDTPRVAAAIADADPRALASALADGSATVSVDGNPVTLGPDDVIVSERPQEGWSVVNEQGETVALDLELDEELRRAGVARDIIRAVQEARKSSGFKVTDRISLRWAAAGATAEAFAAHAQEIAAEVLAVTVQADPAAKDFDDTELEFSFSLAVI